MEPKEIKLIQSRVATGAAAVAAAPNPGAPWLRGPSADVPGQVPPCAGLGTGDGAAQSSARLEQQQLLARCDSAMGLRGGRTGRGDQDGL